MPEKHQPPQRVFDQTQHDSSEHQHGLIVPRSSVRAKRLPGDAKDAILAEVRRETGKEEVVQVHCDEGVASHIGPEPCAGIREDVGEASVGERTGQLLSRDRKFVLGADTVSAVEGKTDRRASASACRTRRGRRPWHVRTLLAREPGDLQSDRGCLYRLTARNGKARSRSR